MVACPFGTSLGKCVCLHNLPRQVNLLKKNTSVQSSWNSRPYYNKHNGRYCKCVNLQSFPAAGKSDEKEHIRVVSPSIWLLYSLLL